ncbi:MAG: hypothetical protein DK306_000365 [Chloroflexi bacterium]|jgi:hypothetical protein|nr:MAG: hypothetical protein DK306_000365 [Chloroflexota bacterium]
MGDRQYYAERAGEVDSGRDLEALQTAVLLVFEDLEEAGFFQVHFGYECIDAGFVAGSLGGRADQWAFIRTQVRFWPMREHFVGLHEAGTLTAIEFLHDHCSKPVESGFHSYGDCGLHVDSGDDAAGAAEFRRGANPYLARYSSGFELHENGEIWAASPPGLEPPKVPETGDIVIDERVQSAISRYARFGATPDDKRHAIRDLADILEQLRATIGTQLPSKAEARLFEIANDFGIRHLNESQKTDYKPEWLDWIFRSFLNSVNMSLTTLVQSKEYEVTRCPACRQVSLRGDSVVDVDKDGPYATDYTLCTNCGWTSL